MNNTIEETIIIAKPPNPAVIPRAGTYLGASFGLKMLVEIKPAAFANGTPTELITIRRFSLGVLLLYHVDVRTEAAEVPVVIKKHEKYAASKLFSMSIAPKTAKPIKVDNTAIHMKSDLIFKKSDENDMIIKEIAPQIFGATVNKFVSTVDLPKAPIIWGNQLLIELIGTPIHISTNIHATATGCLKTFTASLSEIFSSISAEESVIIR